MVATNKGFTLVEVLIATALIGVAAVAMSDLFVGQNRQMRTIQVKSNFDQIRNVVQNTSRDPDSIRRSANCYNASPACDFSGWTNDALSKAEGITGAEAAAPANQSLLRCVLPTGTTKQCQNGATSPVFLYSPDGRLVSGLYTLNGVHCNGSVADAKCPILVTTFALPTCPVSPDLTTAGGLCNRAQTVQIGWKVEQVKEVPNLPHLKTVQATFTNTNGMDAAYAVPVSTQNIQATQDAKINCPSVTFTASMLKSNGGLYDDGIYGGLVNTPVPQVITDMDAYGQAVCGIDPGALEANLLKKELCMSQIQGVWSGVYMKERQSTTPSCDLVVVKHFALKVVSPGGAGAKGYTTDQCLPLLAQPNGPVPTRKAQVFGSSSYLDTVDKTYNMTGGIPYHLGVGGALGRQYLGEDLTTLYTQYGLNPADSMDGKITCYSAVGTDVYWPGGTDSTKVASLRNQSFPNFSFTLPAADVLVQGSLVLDLVGGGGGGGGGHNKHKNGSMGTKAVPSQGNSYTGIAASGGAQCFVTLGGEGPGGVDSNCSTAYAGGDTVVSCVSVKDGPAGIGPTLTAKGGAAGGGCGGNYSDWGGSAVTFVGQVTPEGYGGSAGPADDAVMGPTGAYCGTPGLGAVNGNQGGHGAGGCFRAHWKQWDWSKEWIP